MSRPGTDAASGRSHPEAPKAASLVAGPVIVRAGGGESDPAGDRRRRWRHSPAHHLSKWTDRTLGAHAGSPVGCLWGLGALGFSARTAGRDGRVAPPRAH